jgi:hypothetical protein
MIGDPLIVESQPIHLPGRSHPNPVNEVARKLIHIAIWMTFSLWLFNWMLADPMPGCVYQGRVEWCRDLTIP